MLFSLHVSQESHQQLDHNGANTDSRSDHARWQRERYLCHLYTNAPPKSKGIGSTWISSTIDLTVIHDIHDTATGAAAKCLYRKHFANLTRNHQNTVANTSSCMPRCFLHLFCSHLKWHATIDGAWVTEDASRPAWGSNNTQGVLFRPSTQNRHSRWIGTSTILSNKKSFLLGYRNRVAKKHVFLGGDLGAPPKFILSESSSLEEIPGWRELKINKFHQLAVGPDFSSAFSIYGCIFHAKIIAIIIKNWCSSAVES